MQRGASTSAQRTATSGVHRWLNAKPEKAKPPVWHNTGEEGCEGGCGDAKCDAEAGVQRDAVDEAAAAVQADALTARLAAWETGRNLVLGAGKLRGTKGAAPQPEAEL